MPRQGACTTNAALTFRVWSLGFRVYEFGGVYGLLAQTIKIAEMLHQRNGKAAAARV